MKNLIYLPFILLIGCAAPKTHNTPTLFAPSVRGVKTAVSESQKAVSAAAQSNERQRAKIDSSANYAARVDAKIQVILDNWNKVRENKNLE